jgi:prophage DNA circulation protein
MFKADSEEAGGICERVLHYILNVTPTRGRPGADLRTAIGSFLTNMPTLLKHDLAGPPLADIFEKAQTTGVTLPQLDAIRAVAVAEAPKTVGALLMKNSLINFTLAIEGSILAGTTFVSNDDATEMKLNMNAAFTPMEEIAADDMDQMTYQALVRLHAAITFFLIETARPLPRMLNFQFAAPSLPTLVMAYRLYANAGRADELRAENKVVHPAFMRPRGKALSN